MPDTEALGDEIATLAARISSVTHELLTRIRLFDEAQGWRFAQSCAHWLTWRIGLDTVTAREKVRVARALGRLPTIDGAFASGRLSYAQVRAVTRVATPENEQAVLDIALAASGAQLERICRRFRTAKVAIDADGQEGGRDEEAAVDRRVRARSLGDGLAKLEVVVSADEADLVLKAIAKARDEMRGAARSLPDTVRDSAESESSTHAGSTRESKDEVSIGSAPSAADALVHVAAAYLSDMSAKPSASGADSYQVMLHLERDMLTDNGQLAASLDDGTMVSAESLRRVACDTGITAAMLDDRSEVLDIGRRTRVIPTAIRRALWLRDPGCRFPGCGNQRFLHGHHIQHWLHGGRTSLSNLVLLCSFHHRQVHEGGLAVQFTAIGEVEVRTADGGTVPNSPATKAVDDSVLWLDEWVRSSGRAIDAGTSTTNWYGDPVDYDASVESMLGEAGP